MIAKIRKLQSNKGCTNNRACSNIYTTIKKTKSIIVTTYGSWENYAKLKGQVWFYQMWKINKKITPWSLMRKAVAKQIDVGGMCILHKGGNYLGIDKNKAFSGNQPLSKYKAE